MEPTSTASRHRRRRAALAAGALLTAALVAVVVFTSNRGDQRALPAVGRARTVTVLTRIVLEPLSARERARGLAELVADADGERLRVFAGDLPASSTSDVYAVWLAGKRTPGGSGRRYLGSARADAKGTLIASRPLDATGLAEFRRLELLRADAGSPGAGDGDVVLRGEIDTKTKG